MTKNLACFELEDTYFIKIVRERVGAYKLDFRFMARRLAHNISILRFYDANNDGCAYGLMSTYLKIFHIGVFLE